MTADANGQVARVFYHRPDSAYSNPSAINALGTITWTPTATFSYDQYTSLNTLANVYRCAGWGLRLTCTSSLTNANGTVYIAMFPNNYVSNVESADQLPNVASSFSSALWHHIVPMSQLATEPLIIPGKAIDVGRYRYRALDAPGAVASQVETGDGWANIAIFIQGSSVGVSLVVEQISHLECMPRPTSSNVIFDALPSPVSRPELDMAANLTIVNPVAMPEKEDSWYSGAVEVMKREGTKLAAKMAVGAATRLMSHLSTLARPNNYLISDYMMIEHR